MIKTKLITARKERNRTQADMADLLFISQSQYQQSLEAIQEATITSTIFPNLL
jgi:transcriptional regulator with XRE-family HTH domain